jgi:hypothetical protein
MQLRSWRNVLPAAEESEELGSRGGFDLAPQAAQSQPMNPRQQPPLTPFSLFLRGMCLGRKHWCEMGFCGDSRPRLSSRAKLDSFF